MAVQVFLNCQIFAGSYDFSGKSNALNIDYGADVIEVTKFNDGTRRRITGLLNIAGNVTGFFDDSGDVDKELYDRIGAVEVPLSICPESTLAENARAYFTRQVNAGYSYGGTVGDTSLYDMAFEGYRDFVGGRVLDFGVKTTTGSSTGFQLGMVGATQDLFATLHCSAFTGTDLTATIERDDSGAFSTPTTAITFTQLTDVGSEWKENTATEATDDYYRLTLAGTFTSATLFCCVGIQ